MPGDSDLLFGKIAVVQGFCSQAQIDQCIEIQSKSDRPMPLGRHLIDEGFISEDQHSKVLHIQRKNLKVVDPVRNASRETVLFGKLAVREGFLKESQVNECLRLQALDGEHRTLGEVAVALGFLSTDQVKLLLAMQLKKIMSCPECALSYTVLTISHEPVFKCPKCKGALREGKTSESVRTDAEFETQTAGSIRAKVDKQVADAQKDKPLMDVTCKICCHPFSRVPDSTNRVRCPSCHTTFVVKIRP